MIKGATSDYFASEIRNSIETSSGLYASISDQKRNYIGLITNQDVGINYRKEIFDKKAVIGVAFGWEYFSVHSFFSNVTEDLYVKNMDEPYMLYHGWFLRAGIFW